MATKRSTASPHMTVREAADLMGVSAPTVCKAIRMGHIGGGHQVAGRYVINRAAFARWWEAGAPKPDPVPLTHAVALRVV